MPILSRVFPPSWVHGGEEQEVSNTQDNDRQNHISKFHSDDSSSGQSCATALPSQANDNAEKNHGLAKPVVRHFLTDRILPDFMNIGESFLLRGSERGERLSVTLQARLPPFA